MKKLIKFILGLVILLALVVGIVLVFWLGPVVQKAVEDLGPDALGAEVKVEEVSIRPLSGTARIRGLVVGNPEGFANATAIEMGDFRANLKLSSLMSDTIVIEKLWIHQPLLTYEKKRGTDNIKQLMRNVEAFSRKLAGAADEKVVEDEKPGKKVIIEHLLITDGRVRTKLPAMPTATFALPNIERRHIGGESEGTSFVAATKEVVGSMREGTLQAVKDGVQLTGEGLKKAGGAATKAGKEVGDKAKQAVEGLGGLFKKKD